MHTAYGNTEGRKREREKERKRERESERREREKREREERKRREEEDNGVNECARERTVDNISLRVLEIPLANRF